MAKKKKKILFHSDFSLLKTGFARNAKLVLTYLHNTGKYDIVHYCCGVSKDNAHFDRLPWKSIGSLTNDPAETQQLNRDPRLSRMASYGSLYLDDVVCEEKPDVYIAVQDIWGIDYAIEKKWFPKTNCLIWTTLDSLPILPQAIQAAKKAKNYWVWSDFARKALDELGETHIKTVHGALDSSEFFRLPDEERQNLRRKLSIPKESFIAGFVFRNQLRKSVPNLLQGYAKFREKNKKKMAKSYLLLHTHFGEGWGILKLAKEMGVPEEDILTTYVCKNCGIYEVKNFSKQDLPCHFCKNDKSLVTTSPLNGVTETQLNEIYNLMDVYVHPFTSGGQEIPVQEAKLAELITLVTNYSCGEDMCEAKAHSLPLSWTEYREHGTEFIKASTEPASIEKQLSKVFNMSKESREKKGRKAREWVEKNFSVEKVGKTLEEFIDSCPEVEESAYDLKENKDPSAIIDESLPDDEWIRSLYKKILDMDVADDDKGVEHWKKEMSDGTPRADVEKYFRGLAKREVEKKTTLGDVLDEEDKGKRILFVIPESAGDVYLSTSLFENLKETYPSYNLYVTCKPEYFSILEGNPHVHKIIPYVTAMDNLWLLEGRGKNESFFEVVLMSHVMSQRHISYTHNGKDKIAFDLVSSV